MRAAIYCRVSTEEQNPQLQEDSLRDYAARRGIEVYKVYTDKISGMKDSRPALNELLMDGFKRQYDVVLVWKLDRLGRSLQHLIRIVNNLKSWNVGLICETQAFDTTTTTGILIFQIFGAIAEFERNLISERTKLGVAKAKNVGKRGKDKNQRKKGGYYLRYQKKGGTQNQVILT